MNETKSKTKISSGTIAIIALSIVLILSLVTTVTLAYFSATRKVVTNIQFANGVTLQMQGAQFKDKNGADTPPSKGTDVDLYWVAKTGTGGDVKNPTDSTYGGYSNVNAQLKFEDLKVRVVDSPAYVAVKWTITATQVGKGDIDIKEKSGYQDPGYTSAWTPYTGHEGWHVYRGTGKETTAQLLNNEGVTSQNYSESDKTELGYEMIFASGYGVPFSDTADINDYAGVTITITINIVASDNLDGLAEMVA